MLPQQINALDNIHYCYFVRLERLDEARLVRALPIAVSYFHKSCKFLDAGTQLTQFSCFEVLCITLDGEKRQDLNVEETANYN
jgi:hypothetical protein